MEYTVEFTDDRAGIAAWLPSVSVTAAREHSQVWNTQWNTLVTEQELQLGFLQKWRWRSIEQVSQGRKASTFMQRAVICHLDGYNAM